ncbi:alpha/beta fold hydrolase [Ramlibacter sp. G-1-2-2]|uniref:Alpha/beta fold hydrolase n=1 Tax=Ramlibacter agri TaxID=2728837 RepID=A0A848H6E8_9BURK|nr:alpha/beta fold hydrolase [Ramlibacter agri]NML44143.1 alpha/beta fold hydrolase [Ramlibacter agri]
MKTLSIGSYTLESGQVLPDVQVAYVTHGTLDAQGANAVLVTHGYTSGPSMLSPGHHTAEGSWASLLGPGRPLDTDRFFFVCSNMLGSAFGTTGPRTINAATGKPWGPDFPAVTLHDIVGVQHRLLEKLGVQHLRAVAGPSYGGWQALQWALQYPEMVDAAGVLMSGITHPPGLGAEEQRKRFAASPQWHGGWYYEHGGMFDTLFEMRLQTLRNYGLERLYEDRMPTAEQRQAELERQSRDWADKFDPNSMVVLAGAAEHFDVRPRLDEIRARLLFVVCTTDKIFPPDPAVTQALDQVRGEKRYRELDSPYGHMASGVEWRRLEDDLRWLLP